MFDQIEGLCHDWISRVGLDAMDLDREEAVALLLNTLETVLGDGGESGDGLLR